MIDIKPQNQESQGMPKRINDKKAKHLGISYSSAIISTIKNYLES